MAKYKTGKLKREYFRGSYTVEAAVVFSLVFFVLTALIFYGFLIHDRAVSQSAACEAASAGSNFILEKERKEAADAVRSQIGEDRFLGSRDINRRIDIGSGSVHALWQGSYTVPGFTAKYLSGNVFSVRGSWSTKIPDPADMIRKIKGIGDVLMGGSD